MRLALVALSLCLLGATQNNAVDDDFAKLQGTWEIVSMTLNGKTLDPQLLKQLPRLTIKGKNYTWADGNRPGSISLDPSKKPKTVDYTITEGDDKGKVDPAIYQIDGDTWRDCINISGKERPREFAAPEGSGFMLVDYRRVK